MERNPSIDCLKGLLILMVIGGHVLEVEHQKTFIGWIGTGLRMPLVVGLSGYVLSFDRLRATGLGALASKYGRRLVLPWLLATLVYISAGQWPIGATTPVDLVLRAPFHLWYIPALCAFILIARLSPISASSLLLVAAPFSLATVFLFGMDHALIGEGLLAIDSRFTRYFLFFCVGAAVASTAVPDRYRWAALAVTGAGLMWWGALYATDRSVEKGLAQLLMNSALLSALPLMTKPGRNLAPLSRMGRGSLFFYLWHPLAIGLAVIMGLHGLGTFIAAVAALATLDMAIARLPRAATLLGIASCLPATVPNVRPAYSAG